VQKGDFEVKRFIAVLVVFTFIVSWMPSLPAAAEGNGAFGTRVQGIISEDIIWGKEGSPYFLERDVEIAYGSSLTIEPGVQVISIGPSINVWGDLIVHGTEEEMVFLHNTNIEPYGKSNELASVQVEHAYINRGRFNSRLSSTPYSSLILKDSVLNKVYSMEVYYPRKDSYIERNIFYETGGFDFGTDYNRTLEVRNNLFYKQQRSYLLQSMIFSSEKTKFEKNSFVDIDTPIKLTKSSMGFDLDARNNYWGTADTNQLDRMILDKKDSLESAGYVIYDPILAEPDAETPKPEDIPVSPPTFWGIDDLTEEVEGTADPGDFVVIDRDGQVIGKGEADAEGEFNIAIDPQPADSVLMVRSERDGEKSFAVPEIVEAAPEYVPSVPNVKDAVKFTDKTTQVEGNTSAWARVVVSRDGQAVAEAKTKRDGKFSFSLEPQPGGAQLEVYAVSSKGNKSGSLFINVKDTTAPAEPKVDQITNLDEKITGTTEPGAKISITKDDWYWVGSTEADEKGYFELAIDKPAAGTFFFVKAEDLAGNKSEEAWEVVADKSAPQWAGGKIEVSEMDGESFTFSWPAASDEGTVKENIRYRVYLNELAMLDRPMEKNSQKMSVLEAGTLHTLKIYAIDEAGNLSEPLSAEFTPYNRPDFPDVSLYKDEIFYLAGRQIIKGFPDGTFKPAQTINRLQAVQMILRAKGIDAGSVSVKNPGLRDVKEGRYGYEEVAAAVELGIISGKTDPETGEKYFDPWGTLTRAQMAKILSIAYSLNGEGEQPFSDIKYDFWARSFITALYTSGITTGYPDGTFKPDQSISRQHFSAFLARYLMGVADNSTGTR
jgi:hypothetical protein